MVQESIENALRSLRAERGRLSSAIQALEGIAGNGALQKKRAARSRRAARARAGTIGKKNAPRGLLREKIHSALRAASKPLRMVELRNAVLKAGYPAKSPQSLYTSVFLQVKKDSKLRRTKDGFQLRGR